MSFAQASGRSARIVAALTVAATTLILSPQPARAVEPYAGVYSNLNASALAIGTAGKEVGLFYNAYAGGGASRPDTVTVTIDLITIYKLNVRLKAATPGCTTTGMAITCTKRSDAVGDPDGDLELVFTPTTDAKVGDVGQVRVTTSAPGVDKEESTYRLAIAESGPDLRARRFKAESTPGGTVTFRPQFRNAGDRTAETLILYLGGDTFATYTDRFANCHYNPDPAFFGAVCVLRGVGVPVGGTVRTTAPLTVKVGDDVPGRTFAYYNAEVLEDNTGIVGWWDSWPKGNGSDLRFEGVDASVARDVDYADTQGNIAISTPPNPSDVAAIGATGSGSVGGTLKLRVGMTNKGPGYINGIGDSQGSDPDDPYNAGFRVTFPSGVQVTAVDENEYCRGLVDGKPDGSFNEPGRTAYHCIEWALGVGETYTVEFTVKITGPVGTAGTVVAHGGSSDPVPANNTAAVTVTAGGGNGGGGGGGGGLPITGANVALVSGAGAVLLAVGAGLFVAARRRRSVFVAD
ncbi:hypothetical protein [Virgisporangium aliadipatigenens]|uniref:hypothetical protein n=1 Tax=Virgisporangium aliadipatigenens TaxID=741659 RepID=UPI0019431028|nr:hypothetical protein [Virgisporangium aliadipatigenens]